MNREQGAKPAGWGNGKSICPVTDNQMGAKIKKPQKNSQGFQQNEKKMPGPQINPPKKTMLNF